MRETRSRRNPADIVKTLPPLLASVYALRFGVNDGVARTVEETAATLKMPAARVAILDELIADGATAKRTIDERLRSFLVRAKALIHLRHGLDDGERLPDAEVAALIGWPLERVKAVLKSVL
jgi:DNA-directed RNA polymerase sigma subunit (sigma70/sigma32)